LKVISKQDIAAITVTAFGVDGAPFDQSGKMLYPVISWQCERTQSIMDNINRYIPLDELFRINGVQPFGFNTINKLIWFKENKSSILDETAKFLFIPSIFIYRLTGIMMNDSSMAGTSMMTDIKSRSFSDEILGAIDIDEQLFLPVTEPGTVVGQITARAAEETGLPEGVPVVAAGHDTQFAIFGSGASKNVPVLSSGTWEILMVRAAEAKTDQSLLEAGVTTELDPIPGLYNIGIQWIASGAVEWIKKMFFRDVLNRKNMYDLMIAEALTVPAGCNGVRVNPSLYPVPGNRQEGAISGINFNTLRGEIFKSVLEALSFKTKNGLDILQKAGDFKAESLICVGGGAKNRLWNQIRADVLGIPVKVVDQKETTVLGAALFAFSGIGYFSSPEEARSQINFAGETFSPGRDADIYLELAEDYLDYLSE
jgi:L-fuculokinase